MDDLIGNIRSLDTNNNVRKSLLSTLRPVLDILSYEMSKNDLSACRYRVYLFLRCRDAYVRNLGSPPQILGGL